MAVLLRLRLEAHRAQLVVVVALVEADVAQDAEQAVEHRGLVVRAAELRLP